MLYYKDEGLTLQINLKSLCNLDCDYCLLPKHVKSQKESDKIIVDNTKMLIAKIKEDNDFIKAFSIFGAEPFTVQPEIMAEVLNLIGEEFPGAFLKVQTNGTLCTPTYMEKFNNVFKYPKRLLVGFSIDGVKDLHDKHRCDSWDLIEKNFIYIKQNYNYMTNVICTTNNEHYDGGKYEVELLGFIRNMQDTWNTFVTISFADLTIRGIGESHIGESKFSKSFADFLIKNNLIRNCIKLFKEGYCYRKGNDCDKTLIDLNSGNTYQCEKEFNPDKDFIKWKDHTIAEVMEARAERTGGYKMSSECDLCEYKSWCKGGCPLKRDDDGLAISCYVTKTVLTHIKENINPNWSEYLISGIVTK